MVRIFSGIQPTGTLHIGNLFGAVMRWPETLDRADAFYCVVDLHSLTLPIDPATLRSNTVDLYACLIAAGVDPDRCTLFVQSQVPAHAELGWIMQTMAGFGELSRMTQFKDKRAKAEFVSAGLFAYPALMAGDILGYDADEVPVGDDQRQHVELARDIAQRINSRYGPVVRMPKAVLPASGARVMDLQEPTAKMSKSTDSDAGCVLLTDTDSQILKKFKRAVTDSESEVRFDPDAKPGVSNLLSILAAATDTTPQAAAEGYSSYGPLKTDTAEAVIAKIAPVRARYDELVADPGELVRIMSKGAAAATATVEPVRDRLYNAVGLVRATPPAV